MKNEYPRIGEYLSSCHASSVCSIGEQKLIAYFGRSYDGAGKAAIWVSRKVGDVWEKPAHVVSGKAACGVARACWNPVLLALGDTVYLYFKVGRTPSDWAGYFVASRDKGESWSSPEALAGGILGPTRSAPIISGGLIISGSCTELYNWRIHFELSRNGYDWRAATPVPHGDIAGCIQPALLDLGNGCLRALARSNEGCIVTTCSTDYGETWSPLGRLCLPNPNAGIAALSLASDRHVLAYNPSTSRRNPLVLAASSDGENWMDIITLDSGNAEYSYPSLCATKNGIMVSYSVDRVDIACVEIDHRALDFIV